MAPEPADSTRPSSLLRLVGLFFSPLGLRRNLESPPSSGDPLETAGVRYRNSVFLLPHMGRYVNRSAAVVLGCFFAQPLLAVTGAPTPLMLAWAALLLIAVVHAAVLGFYRQVLIQRADRCAAVLGIERPDDRDPPAEFPPPDEQ